MLFKQRKKIDFISRILNFFWPRNGWGRLFKYTTLRIKRLPGSPHSIALGFTFGVEVCIEGTGIFDGVWTVQDRMNKRWTKRIDFLVNKDVRGGKWNNIKIYINE